MLSKFLPVVSAVLLPEICPIGDGPEPVGDEYHLCANSSCGTKDCVNRSDNYWLFNVSCSKTLLALL